MTLLQQALSEYEQADEATRQEYIQHVEKMLYQHERGITLIGYGYAEEYITAGKQFLEHVKND